MAIALEISPRGTLDPGKQLEWKRDGIEVLAVVDTLNAEIVNVYVPPGKLRAFERRIREYLTEENAPRKKGQEPQPKNARLINAISSIRRAAFAELWTDKGPLPDQNQAAIFQIWLRLGTETPAEAHTAFRAAAERLHIALEPGYLTFPGRVVVAALSTRAALNLPWPRAELERLGEAEVSLKITLSYFIQPNPSRRGWHSKFRYQSHGLRFAVRGAGETEERFHQRINGIKRDEMGDDREESMPDPDNAGWLLRRTLRSQGSLHSDTWYGLASELANKAEIAVYPVGGWWKELADRTQKNRRVRYALVVSLDVLTVADVDIYTPIANQIVVPVTLA